MGDWFFGRGIELENFKYSYQLILSCKVKLINQKKVILKGIQ